MQEGRLRYARQFCPFRWLNIGILRCSPLSAQWWLNRQPMIILARFVHDHTSFQCTNNGGMLHFCLDQRFGIFSRMAFIASLDAYVTGHYSSMANSFVRRCDPLNRNLQTVRIQSAVCNSVLTHIRCNCAMTTCPGFSLRRKQHVGVGIVPACP